MTEAEAFFTNLVNKYTSSDPDIVLGKMMSAPGLKDKVFAFFNKEAMGFRLGPNYDPDKQGIKNHKPLSPFRKKPPLKGWWIIDYSEKDHWEQLVEISLSYTKTLK